MFAMIPAEEYKNLIISDLEHELLRADHHQAVEEIKELKEKLGKTQEKLIELLNCITQGIKSPKWEDGKYEGFDLADNKTIADYINKNFVKDGILTVKGNDNND